MRYRRTFAAWWIGGLLACDLEAYAGELDTLRTRRYRLRLFAPRAHRAFVTRSIYDLLTLSWRTCIGDSVEAPGNIPL